MKLSNEVKRYIVTRLAAYDTPTMVAADIREEFGITITRQQAASFDPTKGGRVGRQLRTLFADARTLLLERISDVPIAHKAVRLHRLERIYTRAETSGNLVLAMDALEQAAKEMGGVFTNRQVITTSDPVEELAAMLRIPADEIRAALAEADGRQE